VLVVPDGTYKVEGLVTEESSPALPVPGVRVEVEGGPSTATDFDGRYRLYGVAAGTGVRFSKPGYVTVTVAVAEGQYVVDAALAVDGPRRDFAGRYSFTIEAAPECRDALPDHLLTRRYDARVTQLDDDVRIALDGEFLPLGATTLGPSGMNGRVAHGGNALEFSLTNYGHCEYTEVLVEKVEGGYLQMEGGMRLQRNGTGLSGTFDGGLFLSTGGYCSQLPLLAGCRSTSHRVSLTR
jgi:hypothetical protein